ncbi:MAG: hypothetical protein EOM45_14180 [Clostridia bacterium]|jgi:hypothetical protein|nr:hypothetical protein [Clostridia bacterium]
MGSESSILNDKMTDNSVMLLQSSTKLLERIHSYLVQKPLEMITIKELLIVAELVIKANTLAYELMRLVKNKENECERG